MLEIVLSKSDVGIELEVAELQAKELELYSAMLSLLPLARVFFNDVNYVMLSRSACLLCQKNLPHIVRVPIFDLQGKERCSFHSNFL